jgi:hypothetical protein
LVTSGMPINSPKLLVLEKKVTMYNEEHERKKKVDSQEKIYHKVDFEIQLIFVRREKTRSKFHVRTWLL